jgi:hypothetical protein
VLVSGAVLVLLAIVGWWRGAKGKSGVAEAIVEFAARRLSASRPEWGEAMAAELALGRRDLS